MARKRREKKAGGDRIFFGVFIADALRPTVVDIQHWLKRSGDRVKWVEPENLHFTLRFIGDTLPEMVPEFIDAASRAASRSKRFAVNIAGVGAFPSPTRARTIWVGASNGSEPFIAMEAALAAELSRAQLSEPERRPFTPHCTLGRVRERPSRELASAIESLAETNIGPMQCEAFSLVKSTLTGSGPVYEVLEEFGLPG